MADSDGIDFTPTGGTAVADDGIDFTPTKSVTPPIPTGDGIDFKPIPSIAPPAQTPQVPTNPAQAQDAASSTPLTPQPQSPYNLADTAKQILSTVGTAAERYPQGIMKTVEDLQAAKTPDLLQNFYSPTPDPRSATEIAQDIGERAFPSADNIKDPQDAGQYWGHVAGDFLKDLPFTTAGVASEFLNPINALVGGAITKVPNVNIPAPQWVDNAVNGFIKFAGAPFSSLNSAAKTQATNAIVDTIFDKAQDIMPQLKGQFEQQVGREATDDDIKSYIRAKLDQAGLQQSSLAQQVQYLARRAMGPNVAPSGGLQAPETPGIPVNEPQTPTPGPITQEVINPGQTKMPAVMSKLPETVPGPKGPIPTSPVVPPVIPNTQPLAQGQPNENIVPVQTKPNAGSGQVAPNASNTQPLDANTIQYVNEASQAAARPEVQATQTAVPNSGKLGSLIDEVHAAGGHILDTQTNPETGQIDVLYQKPTAPDLSSESGHANIPGVDELGGLINEKIKSASDYLNHVAEMAPITNNLEWDLGKLKTRNTAREINAVKLLQQNKQIITPADNTAITHYADAIQVYGDPHGEILTPKQMDFYQKEVKPIQDAKNDLFTQMQKAKIPVSNEGHLSRVVMGKGGVLDRIKEGAKGTGQGSILNKSSGFLKKRTMKSLADEQGKRVVASIKNKQVTILRKGERPNYVGSLNLKPYEDLMNKELKPLENKRDALNKEIDILSKTKSREKAAQVRLWGPRNGFGESGAHAELSDVNNKINDIYNKYSYRDGEFQDLNNKVFQDNTGKRWKIGEATIKEIEANTDLRYHKNPQLTELLAFNKLKQIQDATQFLESFKSSPSFNKIAMKSGTGNPPENWETVKAPQFWGYYFDPKVAASLDKFYGSIKNTPEGIIKYLTATNDLLTNAILINPLMHIPNLMSHWSVQRGWRWFLPKDYLTMMNSMAKAVDAVIHVNPEYTKMLDNGANLLYHSTTGKTLSGLLLDKMGTEIQQNDAIAENIGKALGFLNPIKDVQMLFGKQGFSSKVTWFFNDVLTMEAVYEEMAKGHDLEGAIRRVGKHIPDYRIPAQVLGSKDVANLLQNRNVTIFASYHYGALKSYGEMMKSLVFGNALERPIPLAEDKGGVSKPSYTKAFINSLNNKEDLKERWDTLGQVFMVALGVMLIAPILDQMMKKITGNKNAMVRRAGAGTVPYNIYRVIKGKMSATDALLETETPSPLLRIADEQISQHNIRTGQSIAPVGEEAQGRAQEVEQNISPLQYYQRLDSGQLSPSDLAWNFGGVSFPKNAEYTDAENLAEKLRESHFEVGGMTQVEQQQSANTKKLQDQYNQTQDKSILQSAVDEGVISKQRMNKIIDAATETPLQRLVRTGGPMGEAMSLDDMKTILTKGNPNADEKKFLIDTMQKKIDNARKSEEWKNQMQMELDGLSPAEPPA